MSLGRRKVSVEDERSWVFNRMVSAYEARPAYPVALVETLAGLAGMRRARVADIGAGLGHLALPLAARDFEVTAVEPAVRMLERLDERARERMLPIRSVHAQAEALPLPDGSFDLVVLADALHFIDSERAAYELARVLAPRGALALVTCEFASTPFMQSIVRAMQDAAPRRPREVSSTVTQLLAVARIRSSKELSFFDEVSVDHVTLEGILRSISFIGPAMNAQRYAAFRERVLDIEHEPRWARTLTLHYGHR